MIDFHCHLELYSQPDSVIEMVVKKRMYVLAVSTTPKGWMWAQRRLSGVSKIRAGLGMHPQVVQEKYKDLPLLVKNIPKASYVGEIGIDGSKQSLSSISQQKEVFEEILEACTQSGGKIMSIHSRHADDVVLELLKKYPNSGIPVLHWFSGAIDNALLAVKLGAYFSIGPSMIKTKKGQELIKMLPKNRVLTETDGPFALNNGLPLMPWDVAIAIDRLAILWNSPKSETETILLSNFRSLVSQNQNTGG